MYRSCVPLKRDAEMPEALISTGLDGVYPYMDICRCEQMGRAHRSHRWGHWFESSTDHTEIMTTLAVVIVFVSLAVIPNQWH